MSFTVLLTDNFNREFKQLFKKIRSLEQELTELYNQLAENPSEGALISTLPTDNKVYKIRLAVKSKGKGKSGGMRIISYTVTQSGNIYLLSIYDKNEKPNISNKEIQQLIKNIPALISKPGSLSVTRLYCYSSPIFFVFYHFIKSCQP